MRAWLLHGFVLALALGFLLTWSRTAITEEPSGGAGGRGPNPTPASPEASGRKLPWPEPEEKAVEVLKKELREQLPAEDFCILRLGPWVVATDLDERRAKVFVDSTIGDYAATIQRQLFTSKPRTKPVKVLLFKDAASYNAWNEKLFGEKPGTPYGYYSRSRNALVMNIGTGGGTLLHEMVHAMAEPDFPAIPAWLNEGLGSLFEQSGRDARGKVIGLPNWRLKGLQAALNAGTATKLKDLIEMSDNRFYDERRSGANYASARYLMQYLQEQGKLEEFYTRVREKKDADAAASLRGVFENKLTIDEIEEKCHAWVKTLRFP